MKTYLETSEEVLNALASNKDGLKQPEAQKRLEQNEKNRLKEGEKDSMLKRFLNQIKDPMILVLLAAL